MQFLYTNPVIIFYVGILTQAIFLLLPRITLRDVGWVGLVCAAALLGFYQKDSNGQYDLYIHLFAVACVFSAFYALVFKDRILTHINKEVLMLWNFVFLYIYVQSGLFSIPILTALVMLGSVIAIVNAFFSLDTSYALKAYFYVWFLALMVGILSSQFAFQSIAFFFNNGQGAPEPFGMFFIGASFLWLAVNAWYIIELVPLPGRSQSFRSRLQEVKSDIAVLVSDYDVIQENRWVVLGIALCAGGLLAANYILDFVSPLTLVPLVVAVSHFTTVKQQDVAGTTVTPTPSASFASSSAGGAAGGGGGAA